MDFFFLHLGIFLPLGSIQEIWGKISCKGEPPRSWKNSRLDKRKIWENFCLQTGTPTDSKGFCKNSGLGKGISGKAPG
jgi:hypothetical protein